MPSFSTRLGRYAAMLGALPSVLGSMKELRAIASSLDRSELGDDATRNRLRIPHSRTRSAA